LKLKIHLNITGRNLSLSNERQPADCTLGFVGTNAPMSRPTPLLVLLAMMAFAANSLLCRLALKNTLIDAGTFSAIRLVSGALVLWLIVGYKHGVRWPKGSWWSALALFAYAAGFSYAYVALPAATGALVLFSAVQLTMIGYGLYAGERFRAVQWLGFFMAFAGLVALLSPSLEAPPLRSSVLMVGAGMAWGVYSLRGKRLGPPTLATAGNFLRSVPFALVLVLMMREQIAFELGGVLLAVASGVVASGLGYAIWYAALPHIKASSAATVQLSVPVLATLGGVALLGEPITLRIVICSVAILSGIAIVIRKPKSNSPQ
jgi:drug/metabolite transporter (DMT)-like permease